jgi:hypothetical protein
MPLFSSGRGKSSYSRPPKEEFQFKLNTVMSHRRRSAPSQANCNGARQKHSSDQGQVIAYEPAEHYTVLSPNEMAWLSNKVGIIHSTSRCFAINGQMARFDENTVALTKCLAFTFAPGEYTSKLYASTSVRFPGGARTTRKSYNIRTAASFCLMVGSGKDPGTIHTDRRNPCRTAGDERQKCCVNASGNTLALVVS